MNFTIEHNPRVLVLNSSYCPIDVIDWFDAMTDWASGRAEIVHHYEDETLKVRSAEMENGKRQVDMICPSVIRMTDTKNNPFNMVKSVPLNRQTLYNAYNGVCCYCGEHIKYDEYTIEHILPKSRGGLSSWDNIAPCHRHCNIKKGNKTLDESGMKLKYEVKQPVNDVLIPRSIISKIGKGIPSESWRPYIYWNKEDL